MENRVAKSRYKMVRTGHDTEANRTKTKLENDPFYQVIWETLTSYLGVVHGMKFCPRSANFLWVLMLRQILERGINGKYDALDVEFIIEFVVRSVIEPVIAAIIGLVIGPVIGPVVAAIIGSIIGSPTRCEWDKIAVVLIRRHLGTWSWATGWATRAALAKPTCQKIENEQ